MSNRPDPVKGELYVIAAPSGAGKTSLITALLERVPRLALSISDTTRQPRAGEVEGEQYHFVSGEEFERGIRDNRYLEHANVFGNHYGTRRSRLESLWSDGRDALLEIDVQGAAQVRARHPGTCSIFILPPSLEALSERLKGRGLDSPEVIRRRLDEAQGEIAETGKFDFIVINDDFERALADLEAVIRAWPLRRHRQLQTSANLLKELLEGT